MRHLRAKAKLGVNTRHRKALLRNLIKSLVRYRSIRTTLSKARSASAFADKMIQLAKRSDLHARRTLISYLGCAETADLLIERIAPHFKDRQGGYTRVLKLGPRMGDAADCALLEFTAQIELPSKPAKEKKKKEPKEEASKEKAKPAEPKKKERKKEETAKKTEAGEKPSDQETQDPKESEKKGGFLSALRRFLKGDEK